MSHLTHFEIFLLLSVIKVAVVLVITLMCVAYTVLLERKVIGYMQNRWGPVRVGPFGMLQPLVDGAKLFLKEDLMPLAVERPLYVLAPIIALGCALISVSMVPFGAMTTYKGVDLFQVAVSLENQPPVLVVFALPVIDSARRDPLQVGVDPDLLPRRRVQRDQRVVPRQHVHRFVHDQGIPHVRHVVAARIRPRHPQSLDVRLGDLIQGRVMRVVGPAAVVQPCLVIALRARQTRRCDEAKKPPGSRHTPPIPSSGTVQSVR